MSLPGSPPRPVPLGRRSALLLALVSLAGLMIFFWPLLIPVNPASQGHATDSPFIFIIILPVLVAIVLAQLSEGGMDSKALAMLGVLSALNAALRPLGAGVNGIETVFFLLILAGWVFGPGFGFVLGCTSLFTSALLTAGVGPWLPFQMVAAGWFAMGAGLLPQIRGRAEIAMLVAYGALASLAYGLLMNLSFWPWALGADSALSFVPGAPLSENLGRWLAFTLATSLGWDVPRAVLTAVLTLLAGPVLLRAVRRATRRAAFEAPVRFEPAASAASGARN